MLIMYMYNNHSDSKFQLYRFVSSYAPIPLPYQPAAFLEKSVLFFFCLIQRGNPILKFVRSVPWEFGDVVPDYVLGQTTCALFLR